MQRTETLFPEKFGTAVISKCEAYRYELVRVWHGGTDTDPHEPNLCVWVMLNPSTADAFADDPTIRRCMAFARAWGYNGIHVVNLFALRSTSPVALMKDPDPVGPDNDKHLRAAFQSAALKDGRVMLGWGANGHYHIARLLEVFDLLMAESVTPWCLGLTKGGHPRHPLYVPAAAERIRFSKGGA